MTPAPNTTANDDETGPEFEYCEYCESDFRTPDRDTPQLAAFWVKTPYGYGQACDDCTDDIIENAPNNTIVVHGAPGEYNYDELRENTHRISAENQAHYRHELPDNLTSESP